MKILDNINHTVREDLQDTMQKGSRVSIAAACFSIYAYQELKKQLEEIAELRFIFTSPTFVQENTPKERREFYIPKLTREKSLYGTEFEVRLRNELTQKALAKECADWVRRKVKFRSNVSGEHNSFNLCSAYISRNHKNRGYGSNSSASHKSRPCWKFFCKYKYEKNNNLNNKVHNANMDNGET